MGGAKARHSRQTDIVLCENIIRAAKENSDFRKTIAEGYISEVAVMSILPGDNIGRAVHDGGDEVFFIIEGKAVLSVGDRTKNVKRHDIIFVQSGEPHNIRNTGHKELKLLCFCAPPSTGTTGMHESGTKASEERRRCARENVDASS
jgi:mannose-6-phosphate isomerase-like protein (cupin superfamily)